MKRKLKCKDCGFEKEIEYTPRKEMKRNGIEVKGAPKCENCGSEKVEII